MSAAAAATLSLCRQNQDHIFRPFRLPSIPNRPSLTLSLPKSLNARNERSHSSKCKEHLFIVRSIGDGGGDNGGGSDDGMGGENYGGGGGGGDEGMNRREAILALAQIGRSIESLPADLAAAVVAGNIPGEIVNRFGNLQKSAMFRWLMQFVGFRERLLADDLFLAKVGMECGVGIFTKTAAEWSRRRENFVKELDFVTANLVMAVCADFMLVWLPAPTFSLKAPISLTASPISKLFYSLPDNAFQVALGGASYSFMQRIAAIVLNGSKLFFVGTTASLIGTSVTNTLIKSRKVLENNFDGDVVDLPIVSTSAAYGVYMAVSSNLRYQVLAGVIEQRMLEPLLHKHKLALSALCFAVRTGNTCYLGETLIYKLGLNQIGRN